jgi:hypothetical protein
MNRIDTDLHAATLALWPPGHLPGPARRLVTLRLAEAPPVLDAALQRAAHASQVQLIEVSPLALHDVQRQRQLLVPAQRQQLGWLAGLQAGHGIQQLRHAGHCPAGHRHHHVAGPQAALAGRSVLQYTGDQHARPVADLQALGDLGRQVMQRPGAPSGKGPKHRRWRPQRLTPVEMPGRPKAKAARDDRRQAARPSL